MVDFDDILLYTMILFQNSSIRDLVSSKIHYLFIDEFQDTNELQFLICKHLFHVHKRVMVVGDPEQTIFSWRFANAKNIEMLMTEFPKIHKIYLVHNYRSTVQILSLSAKLMKSSRKENRDLISNSGQGEKTVIKYCITKMDEIMYIVAQIKKFKNAELGNIAILTRSKFMLNEFEEALERQAIPSRIVKVSNFFSLPAIVLFFSYCRVASGKFGIQDVIQVIHAPNRRISSSIRESLGGEIQDLKSLFEKLHKYCKLCDFEEVDPINDLIRVLKRISDMNTKKMKIEDILKCLFGYLQKSFCQYEPNSALKIDRILEVIRLSDQIKPQEDQIPLHAFLDFVDNEIQSGSAENKEGVVLSTLHGSKGLEWPIVFLPGLEEGILPHYLSQENVEEEKRLFFVGITRAKERLFITNCAIRKTGIVSQESSFLAPIRTDTSLVKVIPLTAMEKSLLKKPDRLDPDQVSNLEVEEEEEEEAFQEESPTSGDKRQMELSFESFSSAKDYKKYKLSQEE